MIVAAIVLIGILARSLPRLLVAALVVMIAAVILQKLRRIECALLFEARRDLYAVRSSTASRHVGRLMKRHFTLALHLVQLRSLFPSTVARAEEMIDRR